MEPRPPHFKRTLVLALVTWLLSACASPPQQTQAPDPAADREQLAPDEQIAALLDQARATSSPKREAYLIQASQLMVEQGDYTAARNLLRSVSPEGLNRSQYLNYSQALAAAALAKGAYFLAERTLTAQRLEQDWDSISDRQAAPLRRLRAELFARQGKVEDSLQERIHLGQHLKAPEAQLQNRKALWHTLMTLEREQLKQNARRTGNRELRGWYQLAALSKNNQTTLEQQQAHLEQWQADWPQHPASKQLPDDLRLLSQLIEQQPRQIALLLPEQGNLSQAAAAVRDGFLAAYYHARGEQSQVPLIRQYDTSAATPIDQLYLQAVAEGAEMVIGPLNKDQVKTLYAMDTRPVPLMSLNYLEEVEPRAVDSLIPTDWPRLPLDQTSPGEQSPSPFYQFGLAAEDEARQAAQRAFQAGHRNALLLTPQRNWSERSAQAFSREWRALGGEVLVDSQFAANDSYSDLVQQSLLINQSQARRQKLTRLLGTHLEFEPRRRQDLDMIFLIASPEQGRQIKPTLAFHYAGDLPVYATSHIYSGRENPADNRDLNGVRFNTMPWLLGGDFPEKSLLGQHTQSSAIYNRLHALGVDAFRLYPRLPQLQAIDQARLYGATGALRMARGHRLEREQVWAEFRRGLASPLTTPQPKDQPRESAYVPSR